MDAVGRIAEAVLYEGYILWPYRRSALKNAQRWNFGVVYPRAYADASTEGYRSRLETQCLLDAGDEARVDVAVRFLHVVDRRAARRHGRRLRYVDELRVGGEAYLSWQETTEREVALTGLDASVPGTRRHRIAVGGGRQVEDVGDGALIRRWEPLAGWLEVGVEPVAGGVRRVTVRVVNTGPHTGPADRDGRDVALRRAFASTHVVLRARGGRWVSSTDPPADLGWAARACRNDGLWPVLAGDDRDGRTMLAAPIILYDYPEIAPESPGDMFDGTEIDKLLVLSVLSLTPEEQDEVRATDPRAREILERCAALSSEDLMRLHGAIREPGP